MSMVRVGATALAVTATLVVVPGVGVAGIKPDPVKVIQYQDQWPCEVGRRLVTVKVPDTWDGRKVRDPVIKVSGPMGKDGRNKTEKFRRSRAWIQILDCAGSRPYMGTAGVFTFRWRADGIRWSMPERVGVAA